jgi:hypothetical protein
VSDANYDELERVIRGAYRNVPAHTAGLCESCTAPTSSPGYKRCVPCDAYDRAGIQLAQGGVVALSWAPMDSQGYQDLWQYKESGATLDQLGRLRTMFALAFTRHSVCIARPDVARPLAVAHVPSTSGTRAGEHPFATYFVSMLDTGVPRAGVRYVGPTGGTKNSRRILAPEHWEVEVPDPAISRVLVLDDTWVSGGHAHSVAAAFERSGVAARVIVLGRALDPSRGDHGAYLRAHPAEPFDSSICPVHRIAH